MAEISRAQASLYTRQRAAMLAADAADLAATAAAGGVMVFASSITEAFANAVDAAGRAVEANLRALAEVLNDSRRDRAGRLQIHQRVAELARQSMLSSYDQLVTAREGEASRSHYRAGAGRLAGGVLRSALARPDMFEVSPDGIRFINVTMLDREAAHWHRIDFGAVGRGSGSGARFAVTFGDLVVGALGLDEGPSPGFALPPGLFVSPEGTRIARDVGRRGRDLFYPQTERSALAGRGILGRPGSTRQSAGIAAKNFTDAGILRMARELGPGYTQYYRNLFERYQKGTGPLTKVQARVTRPKFIPTGVRAL